MSTPDDVAPRGELEALGAPRGAPTVTSLHDPVAGATRGVWRVSVEPGWSAVVKLLHPSSDGGHPMWRAGTDEAHWYYWKREALALVADLVDEGSGLRPPRCLGAFDRSDGIALWLEDLGAAVPGAAWPLERYELAARHIGRWQGLYVATAAVPDDDWLARDWLRQYVARREPSMAQIDRARHLGAEATSIATAVWRERERLLTWVDTFPRTVCHFDVHSRNLFAASGRTVLIDWAFVGIGGLGEDAGTLVADAVFDFHVTPDHLDELEDLVVAGYAAGLADRSVVVEAELVRFWLRAATVVKYTWLFAALESTLESDTPVLNHRPVAEAVPYWRGGVAWLADRAHRVLDSAGPF